MKWKELLASDAEKLHSLSSVRYLLLRLWKSVFTSLVLNVSYIKGEIWVRSVVSDLIPWCLER